MNGRPALRPACRRSPGCRRHSAPGHPAATARTGQAGALHTLGAGGPQISGRLPGRWSAPFEGPWHQRPSAITGGPGPTLLAAAGRHAMCCPPRRAGGASGVGPQPGGVALRVRAADRRDVMSGCSRPAQPRFGAGGCMGGGVGGSRGVLPDVPLPPDPLAEGQARGFRHAHNASGNSPPTTAPSTNGSRPPAPTSASRIGASPTSKPESQTQLQRSDPVRLRPADVSAAGHTRAAAPPGHRSTRGATWLRCWFSTTGTG